MDQWWVGVSMVFHKRHGISGLVEPLVALRDVGYSVPSSLVIHTVLTAIQELY
jgi:hypothetical protein